MREPAPRPPLRGLPPAIGLWLTKHAPFSRSTWTAGAIARRRRDPKPGGVDALGGGRYAQVGRAESTTAPGGSRRVGGSWISPPSGGEEENVIESALVAPAPAPPPGAAPALRPQPRRSRTRGPVRRVYRWRRRRSPWAGRRGPAGPRAHRRAQTTSRCREAPPRATERRGSGSMVELAAGLLGRGVLLEEEGDGRLVALGRVGPRLEGCRRRPRRRISRWTAWSDAACSEDCASPSTGAALSFGRPERRPASP